MYIIVFVDIATFSLQYIFFKLLNIYACKSYKVFVWYFLNNYKKKRLLLSNLIIIGVVMK